MKVVKHNQREAEPYQETKVSMGIASAMSDTDEEVNYGKAKEIASAVTKQLERWGKKSYTTNEIKNIVEETLWDLNERKTAKAFIGFVALQQRKREDTVQAYGVENDAKLTDLGMRIFMQRSYNGETPLQMFKRVSGLGKNKDEKAKFYHAMSNLEFIPNAPTLMNYNCRTGQLAACFVLPIEDSLDGIMDTLKLAIKIQKTGGGTGFAFSRLRHKGSLVNSTGNKVGGVIPWLNSYNTLLGNIDQGGQRKGANMGVLKIDHPDIMDWITCKEDKSLLSNFNISIGITDDFMKCAINNKSYDLIAPHTGEVTGSINAAKILDMIVIMAWKNGEPGVLFLDTINDTHPKVNGKKVNIEATNPCGEQPLLPFESCNLGHINVSKFVHDDWGGIDYDGLEESIRNATIFLNRVIDANIYPDKKLVEAAKLTRKIGIGIMGLADTFHMMGYDYGSHASLSLAGKIMKTIQNTSHEVSKELGFNNLTTTTVAPAGTTSHIANCSSGIEPIYSIKTTITGEYMGLSTVITDRIYQEVKSRGIDRKFTTANKIPAIDHIRMQEVVQRYVDSAVSKTINMPSTATIQEVKDAFIELWKRKCKGGTIYRDGSREGQVLQECPSGVCENV